VSPLSHIDEHGHAFMVDVTSKATTARVARVRCAVEAVPNSVALFAREPGALEEARIAGLSGAKATSSLIPLCHPLPLDGLEVAFHLGADSIEVEAMTATRGQTGVEMEALTACALAAVSLLGSCRPRDPGATVEGLTLWEKRGGKSGEWQRDGEGEMRHEEAAAPLSTGSSVAT
jgi:cyclic pyranopterin monophosphate synthase